MLLDASTIEVSQHEKGRRPSQAAPPVIGPRGASTVGRGEGAAGAANEAGACTRKTLDAFALTVGKRRQVEGLPTAFRLCVGEDDASGCG